MKIISRVLNNTKNLLSSSHKAQLKSIIKTMKHYDMVKDENEKFFNLIYMNFIEKRLRDVFGDRTVKILDAGCGQGRMAIPLAAQGHRVTGMDLSPDAIKLAGDYAREANLKIEFLTGNIEEDLNKYSLQEFDCVICLEVLYMLKNYRDIISRLVTLIKPGGLLILSLRPKLFYVLHSIMNDNFKEAEKLTLRGENYIMNMQLNCLNATEMVNLLSANSLKNIEARGIGVLSGIEGDPQAKFALPAKLNEEHRGTLYQMELKLSEKYPDNARYVLVSGVKG